MSELVEVRVPDIGDFEEVEVVELLVGPGDEVAVDDGLISIESEKATMEIPAPSAGIVQTMHVSLGDSVSEGALIAKVVVADSSETSSATEQVDPPQDQFETSGLTASVQLPESGGLGAQDEEGVSQPVPGDGPRRDPPVPQVERDSPPDNGVHAGPGVRRLARELGVPLERANGSGLHGRVLEDDVKQFVRTTMDGGGSNASSAAPVVDASRFGPTHREPLGKVRRVSARNLARSWQAPHVTQHDEADLSEMEAFRKSLADEARERGVKLSPLHFVMKSVAIALQEFPDMRSSLTENGEELLVRDYVHLGIATETEHGLVVPVVRDVDQKGLFRLAEELADLAERARLKRLGPTDMQGAVFTLSSLGGIGGTSFTPIVNGPEVGILGLSRLSVRAVWTAGLDIGAGSGSFEPRVILPLSLSYDHRVIDGAVAVRFTTRLVTLLAHPAHLLL
ncbi:MAG: 2-oxo acid dehydrogenase subunit E2 [Myxococcota bacterium]|nr:2-oxo acid dehydrogenase subunit E2 [Myxococcota bacterium]